MFVHLICRTQGTIIVKEYRYESIAASVGLSEIAIATTANNTTPLVHFSLGGSTS